MILKNRSGVVTHAFIAVHIRMPTVLLLNLALEDTSPRISSINATVMIQIAGWSSIQVLKWESVDHITSPLFQFPKSDQHPKEVAAIRPAGTLIHSKKATDGSS